MPDDYVTRIDPEPTDAEYRSLSEVAALTIAAATPVVAIAEPYIHAGIGKLTGPSDDGPRVFIQPGTVKPPKDDA